MKPLPKRRDLKTVSIAAAVERMGRVQKAQRAIDEAAEHLRAAGAPLALAALMRAKKSVAGAERHAEGVFLRLQLERLQAAEGGPR